MYWIGRWYYILNNTIVLILHYLKQDKQINPLVLFILCNIILVLISAFCFINIKRANFLLSIYFVIGCHFSTMSHRYYQKDLKSSFKIQQN